MPSVSLPPCHGLPMQKRPLSLSRDDVLWGCRVHCPWIGCQWYATAKDATDALEKLDEHYGEKHSRVDSQS